MYRFGIYPEGTTPELWWGARAIVSKYGLDIPRDRQNFKGDKTHSSDFIQWINDVALPYIEDECIPRKTKNISIDSEDGKYHCEADDKDSGGYLYIGAWTV